MDHLLQETAPPASAGPSQRSVRRVQSVRLAKPREPRLLEPGECEVIYLVSEDSPPALGDTVRVRYLDHCLFRRSEPNVYGPVELELRGWLDYEDDQQYRIVWERPSAANLPGMDVKASGVSVLKKTVLEIRRD